MPVDPEDQASLISSHSVHPSPDTVTKLVKRLRALTLTLLPLQVDPEIITDPTSRVITPQVITAYMAAAGDLLEALPYALLRARAEFLWDAAHNPADYDENYGRAVACEVLARRIVHKSQPDRLAPIMSKRFRHRQLDGDESEMSSALELAIDSHCTIFLSSSEAQDVVNDLWTGALVQRNNDRHDIDYDIYEKNDDTSFWSHLDPSRLSVPRYQNIFRIVVWLFFLVVYSQAVREPLERLSSNHLEEWEVVLYVMALSFFIEDTFRFYKLLRFVTWRAFSFWNVVSFITNSLLLAAFALRIAGLSSHGDQMSDMRLRSFQVLSFVSPLIWMRLITVFDGFKYIGTMQICVARMLQESGIFFALLSVMGIGFLQGLYALDAADGQTEATSEVTNILIQALFGSPDFAKFTNPSTYSPTGLGLYYLWNVATGVILLNILISLFSSAYSDVVDDAEAQFLAYFAGKTVGMIRAPDSFVYPAPFNLIELFLVAPLEFLPSFCRPSANTYASINRYVMGTMFLIPLSLVALFESTFSAKRSKWVREWLSGDNQGEDDCPEYHDPEVDEEEGLMISKVPFNELVKVFPDMSRSEDAALMAELKSVKEQLNNIMVKLDNLNKDN